MIPPRQIPSTVQGDHEYVLFDDRSEHGDSIYMSGRCHGFRLATHPIIQQRLCYWTRFIKDVRNLVQAGELCGL